VTDLGYDEPDAAVRRTITTAVWLLVAILLAGLDVSAVAAFCPGLGIVPPWGAPPSPGFPVPLLVATAAVNVLAVWYLWSALRAMRASDREAA
jgi:membrane protein implicated in regulation of membrane protease activity